MRRDERFSVTLSKAERQALEALAQDDASSRTSVVRRLLIKEAKRRGIWQGQSYRVAA